jgi:RNA polymerase-binding transcription factor DksA
MSVTTENMVKLFGKDVLIENKEDFAKLMKLVEEYEENKKNESSEDTDESNFKILKEIQEILGDKEHETTNDIASSLFYENEFGGLNFGKSFKIYKKGNKELLEEEVEL